MKLQQFVEKAGSHEKAARKLGIATKTITRWLHGEFYPSAIAAYLLKQFRIDPQNTKKTT